MIRRMADADVILAVEGHTLDYPKHVIDRVVEAIRNGADPWGPVVGQLRCFDTRETIVEVDVDRKILEEMMQEITSRERHPYTVDWNSYEQTVTLSVNGYTIKQWANLIYGGDNVSSWRKAVKMREWLDEQYNKFIRLPTGAITQDCLERIYEVRKLIQDTAVKDAYDLLLDILVEVGNHLVVTGQMTEEQLNPAARPRRLLLPNDKTLDRMTRDIVNAATWSGQGRRRGDDELEHEARKQFVECLKELAFE